MDDCAGATRADVFGWPSVTIALFTIVLLAQVGVGIDRAPATPPAAVAKHVTHYVKRPVTPVPARSEAPAQAANLCAHAADIAIDSATQEKVDTKSGIDNFVIHVSIVNRGTAPQGTRAKQIISVYRNEDRIVRMQIPALEQGEAYAFTTKFTRSAEAGANSTTLLFRLGGENYAPRSIEDCNDRDNSFRLTF